MLIPLIVVMLTPSFASATPVVLSPSAFRPIIERFNAEDAPAGQPDLSIPNSDAWGFLEQNIPWFDCPDGQFKETYYYRWWSYRKHLKLLLLPNGIGLGEGDAPSF